MWEHLKSQQGIRAPLSTWEQDRALRDWASAHNLGRPASEANHDAVVEIVHKRMQLFRYTVKSVSPPERVVTVEDYERHIAVMLADHGCVDSVAASHDIVRRASRLFGVP